MPNTLTNDQIISAAYVALFQRAPDQEGLNNWRAEALRQQEQGKTEVDLAKAMASLFSQHPAFTTLYGDLGDAAFIDAIYMNIGGKVADDAGRANWLARLGDPANPITRGELVGEFIYGVLSITPEELQALQTSGEITPAELTDALARQDRLTNKADVALLFTQTMGVGSNLTPGTDANSLESLQQDPAYVASQAIVSSVTEDDATMTAPTTYLNGTPTIGGVIQTFGGNVPGVNYALKVGADTFDGTMGDDTINVPHVNDLGGIASTWEVYDSIKGGKGVDTMNIYVNNLDNGSTGINNTQASTVESVEIINAYNAESSGKVFGGSAIDAAKFVGAEQIWQIDGNTSINNLASTTTAGFRGNEDDINATLTATADATSINVAFDAAKYSGSAVVLDASGAALNAVNLSGVLEADPNAQGAGDTVKLNIVKSTAEVALKGDFDTTVTFTDNETLKTLNAVAVNGNVEVNGAAQLTSITTGSGDDQVGIVTSALNTSITTNAGDDIIGVLAVETDPPAPEAGTGSITIDAGEGNNWVMLDNLSKTISITAGSGNDTVDVKDTAAASGVDSLTISLGDGSNTINLRDSAKETSITTGSGSDTVVVDASTEDFVGTGSITIDTGAGNSIVTLNNLSKTISITGGDGTDEVKVESTAAFSGAESLTISLGDGGSGGVDGTDTLTAATQNLPSFQNIVQKIYLAHAAKTTTITTGAGTDVLTIADAVRTEATTTLTANLGAGDDQVEMDAIEFAKIPATWSINAGSGDDSVTLKAGASRTFVAGDYVALTENLQGFEKLLLEDTPDNGNGGTFNIDASRLTGYQEIGFSGEGEYNLTKVTNQTIIVQNSNDDVNLNINKGGDPLQNLTVEVIDADDAYITAVGNNLDLTVTADNTEPDAYISGDIKTAHVTLESDNNASGNDKAEVYFNINNDDGEASGDVDGDQFDGPDGNLVNLTSITLVGTGGAIINNNAGGALAMVDASGLSNVTWDDELNALVTADSLDYSTDNAAVKETVKLGAGFDTVNFNVDETLSSAAAIAADAAADAADKAAADFKALGETYDAALLTYAGNSSNSTNQKALVDAYKALVATAGFNPTAEPTITNVDADDASAIAGTIVADATSAAITTLFGTLEGTATTLRGTADDLAALDFSFSSTVAKTDTIEGLTLVAAEGTPKVLDFGDSDEITVDIGDLLGTGLNKPAFEILSSDVSLAGFGTLNLALQAVAQSSTQDLVVFQYQGNTYIYGDKLSSAPGATPGQLDDTDLLVKLTGTVDLDLLVSSLNHQQ